MAAVFEGRRELFGEIAGKPALAINSLEWGWTTHPVILLYQCGYLTISDYDEVPDVFMLDYLNLEVRSLISKLWKCEAA